MNEDGHIIKNKNVRLAVDISIYVICIGLAIAVIYGLGSLGFKVGNAVFNEQSIDPKKMGRDVVVVIDEGKTSDGEVAHLLYVNGLAKDEWIVKIQIKLSDYRGKFKAGVYTLSTEMTPTEMFEVLAPKDTSEGVDNS